MPVLTQRPALPGRIGRSRTRAGDVPTTSSWPERGRRGRARHRAGDPGEHALPGADRSRSSRTLEEHLHTTPQTDVWTAWAAGASMAFTLRRRSDRMRLPRRRVPSSQVGARCSAGRWSAAAAQRSPAYVRAVAELAGMRTVVTSASSGLGAAMAEALARAGARVAVAARPTSRLDKAVAALRVDGLAAEPLPMDVRDVESVDAALEKLWTRWDGPTSSSTTPGIGMRLRCGVNGLPTGPAAAAAPVRSAPTSPPPEQPAVMHEDHPRSPAHLGRHAKAR